MTTALVHYERDGQIATITMDDGKVNVFGIPMLRALHAAFDRAERDRVAVVLTGREGYFSAGFDLKVIAAGGDDVAEMVGLDAKLAERLLQFPLPVVAACSGHAFPAGMFLLLCADLRIGADGPFQIGFNEVRIGLTLPRFALALAHFRLNPSHVDRATLLATMYSPAEAVTPGFLDLVVAPPDVLPAARDAARTMAKELDLPSFAATKARARAGALAAFRAAVEQDFAEPTTWRQDPRDHDARVAESA
jgi:enoyl-CoA hydratase